MDFNKNKNNTKYTFIEKSMMISRYIAEILDNDQSIKRLLYYNTKTPLSNKGICYDGKNSQQKDIDFSLIGENIDNGMFDDEMQNIVMNQLYVHVFQSRPTTSNTGEMHILVNVLVDKKYEYLADRFSMRSWLILDRVANILHGLCIDDTNANSSLVDKLGNLEFEVDKGGCRYERLGKGSSVLVNTIAIKVGLTTMRIPK